MYLPEAPGCDFCNSQVSGRCRHRRNITSVLWTMGVQVNPTATLVVKRASEIDDFLNCHQEKVSTYLWVTSHEKKGRGHLGGPCACL